jgi:hypothetical protein
LSLGRQPERGWTLDSTRQAEMGQADLFVFEDKNHNGLYESGIDLPVKNAAVRVDGRIAPLHTDETGHLLLQNLSPLSAPRFELDPQALPDPFLVPMFPAVQIWPRAGKRMSLMLPVTEAGELGGTLKLADGRAAGHVRLQLLHPQGHVQEEVTTLNDGAFLFSKIYPGPWQVRLTPTQSLAGVTPDGMPQAVILSDAQPRRSGFDLLLKLDGHKKVATLQLSANEALVPVNHDDNRSCPAAC